MNVSNLLKDYVKKNNIYSKYIDLSYKDYVKNELGELPSQDSASYYADDVISIIGWNTSKSGVQDLVYTTLSGNMQHGVRINYKHGMQTNLHTHNYIELAYVVHGRLIQNIMSKKEVFSEGEICLIDRESAHTDVLLKEESTVLFLGIEPDFFDQFLHKQKSTLDAEYYVKQLIAHRKNKYKFIQFYPKEKGLLTRQTFQILLEELLNMHPCKTLIVKGYIERLVNLLSVEYRFILTRKEQSELNNALFQDIENYIEENYVSVSVQQLALIFNYSPDYLSKLYFKRTGKTLSQQIITTRIKKAHSLLMSTRLPIEQIAKQVGYNNIGFFYKKFREIYHTTPCTIRKTLI